MDSSGENCIATDKIKKENPDEDIHEFAETAMNELLGWYGYGGTRDEPKMPRSCQSHHESNSSEPESPKSSEGCEWCGKPVDEIKCLLAAGASFCSELCFSQSRRANFKKNKTCDWCRHVRHTVSYVDFQDGASQLQFCSDKCLNQYKMHIFCRETRAHLEMHPHLPEDATSVGGLITPDLWLRNCKSPDRNSHSPSISPQIADTLPQSSPLPLIRVAHPSKIMACSKGKDSPDLIIKKQSTRIQRRNRKRSATTTSSCMPTMKSPSLNDFPQDLRVRHTPPLNGIDPFKFREEQRNEKHFPNSFRGEFYKPSEINPKFFSNLPPQPPPPPLQSHSSLLPPVTVLVPYPIIIPLPLPIPIPIPIAGDGKIKIKETRSVEVQVDQNSQEEEESGAQDAAVLKEEEKVNTKSVRKRKRIAVDSKIKLGSSKNKKSVPV